MTVWQLLVLTALGSSIFLFAKAPWRLFPLIAIAVSGFETLLALHILHFGIRGVNLMLLLGAALAIVGGMLWLRASGKTSTTAATAVAMAGALQFFAAVLA
jgi:hypothetical protein